MPTSDSKKKGRKRRDVTSYYKSSPVREEVARCCAFPERGDNFVDAYELTGYMKIVGYSRNRCFEEQKGGQTKKYRCPECSGYVHAVTESWQAGGFVIKESENCTCKVVSLSSEEELDNSKLGGETIHELMGKILAFLSRKGYGPCIEEQRSAPPDWSGSSKRAHNTVSYSYWKNLKGDWCRLQFCKETDKDDGAVTYILRPKARRDISFLGRVGTNNCLQVPQKRKSSPAKTCKTITAAVSVKEVNENQHALNDTEQPNKPEQCAVKDVCCICVEECDATELQGTCDCKNVMVCSNCLFVLVERRTADYHPLGMPEWDRRDIILKNPHAGTPIPCPLCRAKVTGWRWKKYKEMKWVPINRPLCWIYKKPIYYTDVEERLHKIYDSILHPYESHLMFLHHFEDFYGDEMARIQTQKEEITKHFEQFYSTATTDVDLAEISSNLSEQLTPLEEIQACCQKYLERIGNEIQASKEMRDSLYAYQYLNTSTTTTLEDLDEAKIKDELNREHTGLPEHFERKCFHKAHYTTRKRAEHRVERYEDLKYFRDSKQRTGGGAQSNNSNVVNGGAIAADGDDNNVDEDDPNDPDFVPGRD